MNIQRAARLHILVADDSPLNIRYMSLLLEKMGHEATFCTTGLEALELLAHKSFDAVFLDYQMPVLDGVSTAKNIRRTYGATSAVKLLLLTADVTDDIKKRAFEAGVDCFVTKPLTMEDLNQALVDCGLLLDELPGCRAFSPLKPEAAASSASEAFVRAVDLPTYYQLQPFTSRAARAQMASMVLAENTGSLDTLLSAMTHGYPPPAIEVAAHNLKGAAMLLGFTSIATAAAQIETMAGYLFPADVRKWMTDLKRFGQQTKDELGTIEIMMEDGPTPLA